MQMASIILLSVGSWLMSLNDQLSLAINGVAGRSWLFDSVVALFLDNDLAKAGVIGCCFLAAWYSGKGVAANNRRKILLTTIIAAVCVIAITKTLSKTVFFPRPAIQSQRLYKLEGDQLTEMKRMPVRTPLDEESQKEHQSLVSGNLEKNDLGSFPSDHAGFFLVISFGIWLASRRLGWVALGWTVLVILAGKMISAQHTPLDIAAGGLVALVVLAIFRFAAARRPFDGLLARISQLTIRHGALSSALIFAIVFEMSSTLIHVRQFAGLLGAIRRHVLGLG